MSSLLTDIVDSLTSESSRVANTLRRAKILAHKIGLPEFRSWIDRELNGYSEGVELPRYRVCKTHNLATILDPFGGGIKNQVLPIDHLPEDIRSSAESMYFRQGVGELEGMANEDGMSEAWPADAVRSIERTLDIAGGRLVDVRRPVPKHAVQGVLDSVKNRLLDFVLELQNEAIGTSVDSIDPSKVRNIFQTFIIGSQNAVNVAERLSAEQEIRIGDFESLQKHLQSSGVSDADLILLRDAISSQTQPQQGDLGAKVNEWIGMMIKKAADGVWKVSVDNAGKLLMDALSRFLGSF